MSVLDFSEETFMKHTKSSLELEGCDNLRFSGPFAMCAFYALQRFDKQAFYTVCYFGLSAIAEDFHQ